MKIVANLYPACLVIASTVLFLSCHKKGQCADGATAGYQYNDATGKCLNCEGKEGYNPLNIEQAQATKNCECMDLSKQELYWLLKGSNTRERVSYKILDGYNFRGAKMDSSTLFFNSIINADLRGTKMKNLAYGYGRVNGLIDKYTELPVNGCQPQNNDSITCRN